MSVTNKDKEVLKNILKIQNNIDKLKEKYKDDLEFIDEIETSCYKSLFKGKNRIEEDFKEQVNTDRNIRVGIVGRVKAGKSSLLNSLLFEGKDILPKAPTPMTAALTQIEYSNKNYIEIEFITEDDINLLREQKEEYKKLFERTREEINKEKEGKVQDLSKEAEDRIKSDESNEILIASKEIYYNIKSIKESNKNIYDEVMSNTIKKIDFNNIEEIKDKLKDYVSSEGIYVNFVKSLKLYINLDILKEISILDTPGFNDPLATRNEKANQLLSRCDAILILTPSTHNFSRSDIDAIKRISKREGIQEIYVIISKFDDSLLSDDIVRKSDRYLDNAIENVLEDLYDNIEDNFNKINNDGVFDNILKNMKKRITYSSGMCANMSETFENKHQWDNEKKKVFENFCEKYSDNFSENEPELSLLSLKKLGNIEKIKAMLKDVESKKEDLLKDNLRKFDKRYKASADEIIKEITNYIARKERQIDSGSTEDKSKEINNLLDSYDRIKPMIHSAYLDTIRSWAVSIDNDVANRLNNYYKDLERGINPFIEEKDAMFGKKKRYVRVQEIRNAINNYVYEFNNFNLNFRLERYQELENIISKNIINIFSLEIPDNIEINNASIKILISNITMEHQYKIECGYFDEVLMNVFNGYIGDINMVKYINKFELEGKDADNYIIGINTIREHLRHQFREQMNIKIHLFLNQLNELDFASILLSKYKSKLENELRELKDKSSSMDKWKKIKKEIRNII